jgi:ATP phosphoribosyltransferase
METCTILIANKSSWASEQKKRKLENITILLQGTLNAENFAGLKCNVRNSGLEKVLDVLPALHNPTVSALSDGKWSAVETIIRVDEIKRIIPLLKRAGATGIVEYPVNKVIL